MRGYEKQRRLTHVVMPKPIAVAVARIFGRKLAMYCREEVKTSRGTWSTWKRYWI